MTMRREPHPISGAIFEEEENGVVRVTDEKRGTWGRFRWDGTWLEGDINYADPHMLYLVGGPNLPPEKDIFWTVLPPTEDSPRPAFTGNMGRGAGKPRPKVVAPYVGDPGKETDEGMRSASFIPQEYFIENDRRADLIPEVYKLRSPLPGGPVKIPVERFYKQEYHDLEVEKLWKKTWQMVCREDDIAQIGDYHLYDIADLQFMVVRSDEKTIKAFPNACLHRGRRLRECSGKGATVFRCPYHGWSWDIQGKLKELPSEWDFPGASEDVANLPEAQVATWAGFVFINPDATNTVTLEEHMGPQMLQHYAKTKLQNRYKQADVVKVVRCNWKVIQEAFMEAYHTIATHPQLLLTGGDLSDNRSDVFGNWGRLGHINISASSPHRGIITDKEQALAGFRATADFNREYLRTYIGDEVEVYSDVELVEQSFNNLFPNFSPWGGWGRIVYNFRPHGTNPDECLMQVMLLAPWAEGKPKPAPRPQRFLSADESWTVATELGTLAKIFDQDCTNAPAVQLGLKSKQPAYVWYSDYQESIIRNFHHLYEKKLGLPESQTIEKNDNK